MTRRGAVRGAEDGFTLLELLISITLLGLLFAAVTGGLRFGAAAWQRSAEGLRSATELQTAQALLRRQVEQAWPLRPFTDRKKAFVAFDGTATDMRFLGPAPAAALSDGVYEYGISTTGGTGDRSLVFGWKLFAFGSNTLAPLAAGRTEVLMRGIADMDIAYFGRRDANAAPNWLPDWHDRSELPLLIRFRVRFPPGDGRNWPDLLVAPMTGRPTG